MKCRATTRLVCLSLLVALVSWARLAAEEFDAPECQHTNDSGAATNHINRGICNMSRSSLSSNYLGYAKSEFEFVLSMPNERNTYWHIAYMNLGVVYLMEGNQSLALKSFASAIEVKPDYAEAYFNLGVVYYKQKLLKRAEEAFVKAIELEPGYGRAHYSLGFVYLEQKRYELARRHAELAAENGVPFKTLQERLAKIKG